MFVVRQHQLLRGPLPHSEQVSGPDVQLCLKGNIEKGQNVGKVLFKNYDQNTRKMRIILELNNLEYTESEPLDS